MRIAIDAPAVRSLSANEKMVYQFLRQGLTVQEIAGRMHIPVGKNSFFDNEYDVPLETVMNLITSIREKGWDIPTDNKEENEMARKSRFDAEEKRSIVTEDRSGATMAQIAKKHDTVKSTVYSIVRDYNEHGDAAFETEKEPATVGAVTSSEQENIPNIPADIVTPSEENVKTPTIPLAVKEACLDKIDYLEGEIAAEQAVIDEWKAQIAEIKNFLGGETI